MMARAGRGELRTPALTLAAFAATNRPHEPPARARPIRSNTCAHLLMAERSFHGFALLIICPRYQTWLRSAIDNDHAKRRNLPPGPCRCRLLIQSGGQMRDSDGKNEAGSPPRKGRNSHSEQTDEAPGLIENEQVEIEREIPADDNQPIERIEPRERPQPPVSADCGLGISLKWEQKISRD